MIAALHPCSFVDFPGGVSAVVFIRRCDLRCLYCHNPALRGPGANLAMETVLAALAARRRALDGVVIGGGEPTGWKGLPVFLRRLRALGLPIKLDTHGLRTRVVADLVDRHLVDYLAVDIKAPPGPRSRILCGREDQADNAMQTLAVAVRRNLPCQARTTVVETFHDEGGLLSCARRLLAVGVGRYQLQPVRSPTLKPPPRALLLAVMEQARAMGLAMNLTDSDARQEGMENPAPLR